MRKAIIAASAAVILAAGAAASWTMFHESEDEFFQENVEALAGGEVNEEQLEKMLAKAIWDMRLIYDPNVKATDVYCLTDGSFVCPISNSNK